MKMKKEFHKGNENPRKGKTEYPQNATSKNPKVETAFGMK
jgi:hypothetical protein